MASLNKVFLIGNLTRDPELRYTANGTAVADLRLAVNRTYSVNGERREEALFITVVAWGKQGETAQQYLKKGSPILVEGYLRTREWEGKEGQRHTVTEVVAERAQFLPRTGTAAGSNGHGGQAADPQPASVGADDDVPF